MARDDDPWKRFRDRDEEREREAREEAERQSARPGQSSASEPFSGGGTEIAAKAEDIIKRVPILLEQLEHLYRQYATGVLERPPVEERKRLDQMMVTLFNLPKATPADRFRFSTLNGAYTTYKARWDKLLMDIEKGIIRRITGKHRR